MYYMYIVKFFPVRIRRRKNKCRVFFLNGYSYFILKLYIFYTNLLFKSNFTIKNVFRKFLPSTLFLIWIWPKSFRSNDDLGSALHMKNYALRVPQEHMTCHCRILIVCFTEFFNSILFLFNLLAKYKYLTLFPIVHGTNWK